jgi:squalene-hopene/tetraprenyl-beta-curcumene cyclase
VERFQLLQAFRGINVFYKESNMQFKLTGLLIGVTILGATAAKFAQIPSSTPSASGLKAAASYMDGRLDWWEHWDKAARDHDTQCVSCHTALPYALARPALHRVLDEMEPSAAERLMLTNVVKRVRLWKEVEPFYPDQSRGLPKTSESRGTESVLNAAVLAARDASSNVLSDDTRQAFANMWALQFTAGDLKGAWAWLNFHLEPWEANESGYFGASLAAIAVGTAPGNYAASPEIQGQMKLLHDYLAKGAETERLFNRAMVLWASSKVPGLLTSSQRQTIIDAALAKQHEDGGWSMTELGTFKRSDSTPLATSSDGYATGLMALALQSGGLQRTDARVGRALSWLSQHQDSKTGMWYVASLNKERDPASDPYKFLSDAATAYAVLALVEKH